MFFYKNFELFLLGLIVLERATEAFPGCKLPADGYCLRELRTNLYATRSRWASCLCDILLVIVFYESLERRSSRSR